MIINLIKTKDYVISEIKLYSIFYIKIIYYLNKSFTIFAFIYENEFLYNLINNIFNN